MSTKKNIGTRGRQDWATPAWLFEWVSTLVDTPTLDVCAEEWSAKCENYHTIKTNGLKSLWGAAWAFCNPPFSSIEQWLIKALTEILQGDCPGATFILPASTDVAWFHDWACCGHVYLVRGRVQFDPPPDWRPKIDKKTGRPIAPSNNGGTMVVVFDKTDLVAERRSIQAVDVPEPFATARAEHDRELRRRVMAMAA